MAWHVDNRIDGEKNRGQRDNSAADRCNAQPDRGARTNRTHAKDRYCEHREVNNTVENIRGVIDELKRFLDSGTDLAGDRDEKCGRADEYDGIDRRFVSRMQTRKPIRQQSIPSRNHRQPRAAGYVNAGRRDRAHSH